MLGGMAEHPPTSAPSALLSPDIPCLGCGYNLKGLPRSSNCPGCNAPVRQSLPHDDQHALMREGQQPILPDDRACVRCGYNLKGLPLAGKCPECGLAVEDSLRGILLQYASANYLKTVLSGLSLVLNGILLKIVLAVVGFFATVMVASGSLPLILSGVGLIPSAMLIVGYWRYTQPDPGFTGQETPDSARKVMRIMVCIQAGTTVADLLYEMLAASGALATPSPGGAAAKLAVLAPGLAILIALVGFVAWAVQFFATMRYTRWLARRVPDVHIVKRTHSYMWALPVLTTVGALIVIGPLIALVLYWNLHDRLRKHLKSITTTGRPAALKGAAG
jgi:hypothetical protein